MAHNAKYLQNSFDHMPYIFYNFYNTFLIRDENTKSFLYSDIMCNLHDKEVQDKVRKLQFN